jgi:hypothetical protein
MSLQSFDIVVALKAHLWPRNDQWSFERLGSAVGVSASQAHAGLRRLGRAGLYRDGDRSLRVHAFCMFAEHGIPYAFATDVGPPAVGMATAHAALPLSSLLVYSDAYVWPAAEGVAGRAVAPLHPAAPAAAARDSQLYAALALIDALRVGRVRERQLAVPALQQLLAGPERDTLWVRSRPFALRAG